MSMSMDAVDDALVATEIAHVQPRPQSNVKKIALAPHDFEGNFYPI